MRTCCVKGCDSSKYITLKYYAFFNFPLDNEVLLKKWLNQIDQPDLKPKCHQICSVHFSNDDIVWRPNGLPPSLKPTAVPTIFPPQEASPCIPQSCTQTFLVAMPLDSSSKSSNGEMNGNCKMPLILIPTQYLFPCQTSMPYLIPTQVAAQSQNQPQVQPLAQINPQNQLQIQPFPQINPQNSLHIQPFPQINPQNQLQIQPFPQINPQNTQQPVKFFSQFNAMNPTALAQFTQQITAQNPTIATQCSHIGHKKTQMEVQTLDLLSNDKDTGVANETAQDSVQIAQISQTHGHISAPVFEFPEFLKMNGRSSEELKNMNFESYSEKRVEICQNSRMKGQSCEAISENFETKYNSKNSISEALEINENSQIVSEIKSDKEEKTSISLPILKKIPPKATIPLRKEIYEQEIHVRRVTKPDILIALKNKISDSSTFVDQTKTPILRISINKLCNVASESKYTSEKENSSEERNLPGKSITVENHKTNKSVTFRLDSTTGEIVVENRDIVQLPKKSRSRNTGTKRKKQLGKVRKSASGVRKKPKRL